MSTQQVATVNPLSYFFAAPLSARAPTRGEQGNVPSVAELSPLLHGLLLLVLGPYDGADPRFFTRHTVFWLLVCAVGFGAFGPGIGHCGGGWVTNLFIAGLFLIAFVWYALLRRNIRTVFADLAPAVRLITDPKHNAGARIERDRARMNYLVLALSVGFPATVLGVCIYFNRLHNFTANQRAFILSSSCDDRVLFGIEMSFLIFFIAVVIPAVQLALLYCVAQLYAFRLRLLFAIMLKQDKPVIDAELSADTPRENRKLLAAPPEEKSSPLSDGPTPYILGPLAAAGSTENCGHCGQSAVEVDKFLRVYRSIKDEATKHAVSWSVPLALFICAYFFIFCLTVVSIIRDMVRGVGNHISIEIIYVFIALVYIVLNLVPIIQINSTWTRLLEKPEASLSAWAPEHRLVLNAYFTQHPLVFPVLGLTIDWNKVLVLVATAFAPLLINAAVSTVFLPPNASDGTGIGNSTRL